MLETGRVSGAGPAPSRAYRLCVVSHPCGCSGACRQAEVRRGEGGEGCALSRAEGPALLPQALAALFPAALPTTKPVWRTKAKGPEGPVSTGCQRPPGSP